jgi:hypothetical protein
MAQAILDTDTFSVRLAQENPDVASQAPANLAQYGNFTISRITFLRTQESLASMPIFCMRRHDFRALF